jgi:putative salt-induced outer membrane protein YdiY
VYPYYTTYWRLNWDTGVASKLGGDFSLALSFNLKYDHKPFPGVAHTDTAMAVSLVYHLL